MILTLWLLLFLQDGIVYKQEQLEVGFPAKEKLCEPGGILAEEGWEQPLCWGCPGSSTSLLAALPCPPSLLPEEVLGLQLRARALCLSPSPPWTCPSALALAGLQGQAPTAELRAGLWRLGLTQTTPRVSRFEKCSPSLPLCLWVRFPGPDCAALCLSRGSVLQSRGVTAAVTWLLGKQISGFGWCKAGKSLFGSIHPGVCSLCVCFGDLLCDQHHPAQCSVLVRAEPKHKPRVGGRRLCPSPALPWVKTFPPLA